MNNISTNIFFRQRKGFFWGGGCFFFVLYLIGTEIKLGMMVFLIRLILWDKHLDSDLRGRGGFLMCMDVFACMCNCEPCAHLVSQRPEEDARFTRTGVTELSHHVGAGN